MMASRRAAVRKWRESILISYEYLDHLISVSVAFVLMRINSSVCVLGDRLDVGSSPSFPFFTHLINLQDLSVCSRSYSQHPSPHF